MRVLQGLELVEGLACFGLVGEFGGVLPAGGVALGVELDDGAVAAAEDDEVRVEEAVEALGLGGKPGDLAADGDEGFVAEEGAGTVAGAVEEGLLREREEAGGGVELLRDDAAAVREEGLREVVDEGVDVEGELGGAVGEACEEGVRGEVFGVDGKVFDGVGEAGEAEGVLGEVGGVGLVGWEAVEGVALGELHGVAGEREEGVVDAPGMLRHLQPVRGEGGGEGAGEGDAGVGGPGAGSAEAAGLGGAVACSRW